MKWEKERLVVPGLQFRPFRLQLVECDWSLGRIMGILLGISKASQDDLVGSNYVLLKEYTIEFGGEPVATAADHQVRSLECTPA